MDDIDPQVIEEIRHIQMLIGRNILVFQNVEHLLKEINHSREGAGTAKNLIQRKMKIDELSLGRLSDETVLQKIDSKLNAKKDDDFHFSYEILKDDPKLNSAIKFFNDINDDRNLLVHNFTTKWPLNKSENRRQAKNWLLKQYDAIFAQREILVESLNIIDERQNVISNYLNSEEGKKSWDEFMISDSQEIQLIFDSEK